MMKCTVLLILFSIFTFAHAGNGSSDNGKIAIGQSVELSGEAVGKENMLGAAAYFDWINKQGGINGVKIDFLALDDQRNIDVTKKNTEFFLKEKNAIALFGYRSTPTIEAVMPLLTEYKTPLVAPFSGAQSLHRPFNPHIFHLRASYQDETKKMVESLALLNIKRVAILYQDDSFGKDGLAGFERNLQIKNLKAIVTSRYDRKNLNIDSAVKEIVAANPQAVLMACTPSACSNFIKQIHKARMQPQFLMLSNVNSAGFFQNLGDDGRGVGVMQVMPYPRDVSKGVVREFQRISKELKNPLPASYAALEGFVAAKLLSEGLRRAGPRPTREKLAAALETMRGFDLGGVTVNYSATSHEGSNLVELIVIGKNGAIWR